jgi:hypothetical protein
MCDPRIHDLNFVNAVSGMHRQALSDAIRSERLAHPRWAKSTLLWRFLAHVGGLLIAAGQGLRARTMPEVKPVSEAYCVDC